MKKLSIGVAVSLMAMGAAAKPNSHLPNSHLPSQDAIKAPALSAGVSFNEQHHNRQVALWSLRQINAALPLIDDAWSTQTLYAMTAQMNATVRTQPILATPIISDPSINAFAVPGGIIGINTGTILQAKSLDEVASVLAHEIAHLSQRHYEHRQENNKKLMALQLGGLLAAIAASAVNGDAALAAMAGAQTASAENAAAHSREHEREADRVGQQILVQAGYDAHAMPRFFNHLYKQVSLHQSKNAFAPSFMQSHPFTMERLSESTARASSHPSTSMHDKQRHAKTFDLLYWRLKYLSKQTTLAELSANAKQSQGARLAMVMHLTDHHQYQKAQKSFDEGYFSSEDVLAMMVQADLYTAQHRHKDAIRVLTPLQAIYPERRDLRLYLAKNLILDNQTADALALVQDLTQSLPHDLQAWQLIWRAYEQKARQDTSHKALSTLYALQARSQIELWTGKYDGALQSNAQAAKSLESLMSDGSYSASSLHALSHSLQKDKDTILAAKAYKPR